MKLNTSNKEVDGKSFTVFEFDSETLNLENQNILKELFNTEVEKGIVNFIFDMKEVERITSSGLGILISFHNKVRVLKGNVVLENIQEKILNVFRLTKLDKVFDL